MQRILCEWYHVAVPQQPEDAVMYQERKAEPLMASIKVVRLSSVFFTAITFNNFIYWYIYPLFKDLMFTRVELADALSVNRESTSTSPLLLKVWLPCREAELTQYSYYFAIHSLSTVVDKVTSSTLAMPWSPTPERPYPVDYTQADLLQEFSPSVE